MVEIVLIQPFKNYRILRKADLDLDTGDRMGFEQKWAIFPLFLLDPRPSLFKQIRIHLLKQQRIRTDQVLDSKH